MQELKLDDIVIITPTTNYEWNFCYSDDNSKTLLQEFSDFSKNINIKTKTIKLNKPYTYSTNSDVLYDFIKKIKSKEYHEKDREISSVVIDDFENIKYDEIVKIVDSIIVMNNWVGRFGSGFANSIIIDSKYIGIFEHVNGGQFINNQIKQLKIYYYSGLGDKIIVYKKPENIENSWCLIHTHNYYNFVEVGDFSEEYNVVTIKCLKQLRENKLKRVVKYK